MDTRTSGQMRGIAAMAGCALLWSIAGLFIKTLDWQPFAIAGGRSLVAAVFLLIVTGVPRFSFSPGQIWAAVTYAATMLLFVFANKNTTAANAILLQYGAPVYVALLGAVMLKEIPKPEHILALAGIAGGMVLFFMDSLGKGNLVGDIAAVLAGMSFALNAIFMRKQKDSSPIESLILGHIMTAVVAFGISLFLPAPKFGFHALLSIGALGVIQIGLAGVFFSYAIKRISALQSMLIAVIEPVLNPVWVFLATGELPGARAIVGGVIIILAVVVSSIISVRRLAKAA